jgi:hypothetical protein
VYPLYICGDKEGVYKVHNLIMSNARQGIVVFFVDKDLSDIFGENWIQAFNIFVTDYYSIENYLVNKDMFYRVWTELFHFTGQAVDLKEDVLNKFNEELNKFYEYMLPLVSWGIYLRQRGIHPNLKNINFSDFYFFSDEMKLEKSEKAKRLGDIRLLEAICNAQTPPNCMQEIDSITQELSLLPPKAYISGKLELSFFIAFIDVLVNRLSQELISTRNRGRVLLRTQINAHNAIEILGPRVIIPQSLKEFLQGNLALN